MKSLKGYNGYRGDDNKLKYYGTKAGRNELFHEAVRFKQENYDVLNDARTEQMVLRMKKYFTVRNWQWPPAKHPSKGVVDAINQYYGHGACILSTKKDEL